MSSWVERPEAVFPEAFLGGSAPRLRFLSLNGVAYSGIQKLLLAANHLVRLRLSNIPLSGYIPLSPEVVVTCLSAMPKLRKLHFEFDSLQSFPYRKSRRHPPLARSTLPTLRNLILKGDDEYFEDFVARIDTPVIRVLEITFFHRHIYDFSQLSQFIGHVEVFKSPTSAEIGFCDYAAEVSLRTGTDELEPARLLLGMSSDELHLRLRFFVQVCSSSLLPFCKAESLEISGEDQLQQSEWESTAEDFLWMDLLHTFSAVKDLEIGREILTPVAYTLKEAVKERITGVFPAIQELSIGEHVSSGNDLRAIEKFAAARGLFTLDHPHRWVAG